MQHQEKAIRVLVVDDEEQMTSFIASYLTNEGYSVKQVHSGAEALQELEESPAFDLILLDWMMPGMNGLDVCRRLRRFSDVPVIFLTAKTEEIDKVLGLEIGADDYITKPFSLRELEVRIRVVLRRKQHIHAQSSTDSEDEPRTLTRGRLSIDLPKHTVYLDQQAITVTPTEFKLLLTLAQHPGRVYSRLDLLEIALGEEYSGYERSIDTHIRNLRKKLEHDFSNPKLIVTVHGVGYKFGDPS
ncbi:response regulator transcription factor [Paenibacillus sp. LHD-117]|uniref:response regulator transcription factor n=1 Tax=Paenibacillus sp. LHD-117 TaxID=3071412 RepID=UPI0027E1E145|nr:response regulator transcription factor [Paenibacillus sp. LHD-117]MDQ6423646.1 response regulator transcription factor [Paenibacillus sp. LHD-117]